MRPRRTRPCLRLRGAARCSRPSPPERPLTVGALRAACAGADVVHAHGLHAAVRASLALGGLSVPLVVTWHTRGHGDGGRERLLRLLERRAARAAAVVLATCSNSSTWPAPGARVTPASRPSPPPGPSPRPAGAPTRPMPNWAPWDAR
ncbi:glycosyltransferase [Streptomyces zhihengii]